MPEIALAALGVPAAGQAGVIGGNAAIEAPRPFLDPLAHAQIARPHLPQAGVQVIEHRLDQVARKLARPAPRASAAASPGKRAAPSVSKRPSSVSGTPSACRRPAAAPARRSPDGAASAASSAPAAARTVAEWTTSSAPLGTLTGARRWKPAPPSARTGLLHSRNFWFETAGSMQAQIAVSPLAARWRHRGGRRGIGGLFAARSISAAICPIPTTCWRSSRAVDKGRGHPTAGHALHHRDLQRPDLVLHQQADGDSRRSSRRMSSTSRSSSSGSTRARSCSRCALLGMDDAAPSRYGRSRYADLRPAPDASCSSCSATSAASRKGDESRRNRPAFALRKQKPCAGAARAFVR